MMELTDLTIVKLTKWKTALKRILEMYEEGVCTRADGCPLCDVGPCEECIWTILVERSCSSFACVLGFMDVPWTSSKNYGTWVAIRKLMIPHWIRRIDNAISYRRHTK